MITNKERNNLISVELMTELVTTAYKNVNDTFKIFINSDKILYVASERKIFIIDDEPTYSECVELYDYVVSYQDYEKYKQEIFDKYDQDVNVDEDDYDDYEDYEDDLTEANEKRDYLIESNKKSDLEEHIQIIVEGIFYKMELNIQMVEEIENSTKII